MKRKSCSHMFFTFSLLSLLSLLSHSLTLFLSHSLSNMATDSSYMVLLAFTAGDATQLSIAPGDRVQLITADSGTGWSFGRSLASNAQGWFPASYVQKQQAPKPALRPLSCLPGSSPGSLPVTPPLPQSPLPAAVTRAPPSVASSPLPPSLAPLPPPLAPSASPATAPLTTPHPPG